MGPVSIGSPHPVPAEVQVAGEHGPDDAEEIGRERARHSVPRALDLDRAEVDGQHIKSGLGGSLHGADHEANERVGASIQPRRSVAAGFLFLHEDSQHGAFDILKEPRLSHGNDSFALLNA